MDEAALRENANFDWIRDRLTEWWPALDGIEFTHQWAGYLGIPRDWLPTVHFDPVQRIGHSYGYTGHGVITSAICARALAGLVNGRAPDPHVPYVREQAPNWEWFAKKISKLGKPNVLNLFGYTGVASLVAAQAGAFVTHVDASKQSLDWARENAHLRIAICGHVGDYDLPKWEPVQWSRGKLTYGGAKTTDEECIWYSPACLKLAEARQSDLFGAGIPS